VTAVASSVSLRALELSVHLPIRQSQIRWFAVRRLLTSGLFAGSFAGLAVLILWVEVQMAFFAITSCFAALIAVAYGVRMVRLAVSAQTMTVELSPNTLTRTIAGVSRTQAMGSVVAYPSGLMAFAGGTETVELPIGQANVAHAVATLTREGVHVERMSGLVGTLLPVVGFVLLALVGVVLTRVVVYGALFGLATTAMWSPTLAVAAVVIMVGLALGSWAWRTLTARADRDV
jgi:hypothetical protein